MFAFKKSYLLILLFIFFGLFGCSGTSERDGLSESDLASSAGRDRFGEGSIPLAEGEGMFRDIKFAYDSSSLDGMAMQDVEYNASVMNKNPNLKVILEGHCDERGTNEYNMALGASRAKAVERALVASGISPSKLDTISYGEEIPLDPASNESAWAKNRRVHFAIGR